MESKIKCPKCGQMEKTKNGFHRGKHDISVNAADAVTLVAVITLIMLNRKLLNIIWSETDSEESRD